MDFEAFQLDSGDVKGLAAFKVEWRLKAEFGQGDEGPIRRVVGGDVDTFNLSWRPDSQAAAFGLEAVFERHVKAVELDAGMEVLLEGLYDACADEGLGSMEEERSDTGEHDEDKDNRQCDQFETFVPAPKRGGWFRQRVSLPRWNYSRRAGHWPS